MNDNKHASFNMLIELSKNRVDTAGNQLGHLVRKYRAAEHQLNVLKEYRQDYATRLTGAGQNGITASNYRNFTRFLETLNDAIVQQTRVMMHLDQNISVSKENWRREQQRLHSYETLQTRRARQHMAIENRREQIVSDELSAAIHRRSYPDRGLQ